MGCPIGMCYSCWINVCFALADDLRTQVDQSVQSDRDWISFNWRMSVEECQLALTGFQLKLTDIGSSNTSVARYPINVCGGAWLNSDASIRFNTSCVADVHLDPCSIYRFEIVPEIRQKLYPVYTNSTTGTTTPGSLFGTFKLDFVT